MWAIIVAEADFKESKLYIVAYSSDEAIGFSSLRLMNAEMGVMVTGAVKG